MKNYIKDNSSGKNHEGNYPNRPLRFLTANSIIGDRVLNPKGEHLGVIKDMMINLSNGSIEYIIIEFGGFIGFGEKYFAFPYALFKVDKKNKVFTLDIDLKEIKKSPGFDKKHWPNTNSHLLDHAYSYWENFMGVNTA